MTSVVWFQNDLRLSHQPALQAAISAKLPVLPVYIWAPEEDHPWERGAASKWWLYHSLKSLQLDLEKHGLNLLIQRGPTVSTLKKVIEKTKAKHFFWNRRYEPFSIHREKELSEMLSSLKCEGKSFNGSLLFEPGSVLTAQGKPYQVFTPFWRSCLKEEVEMASSSLPQQIPAFCCPLPSVSLEELDLLPNIPWDKEFYEHWEPGERGAHRHFQSFLRSHLEEYPKERDFPFEQGTSLLSAHLHFGEISPVEMWMKLKEHKGADPYARQLVWRDFAHHLLFHFPKTPLSPLREEFNAFKWKKNSKWLHRWQQGKTGIPIVDAGMRQLWKTGWMHNRVRMIVASFLVKDLLIPWQEGAKWFWDTLVDADLANNTFGWQWTAGCGADAAPYFRIFNPVTQGERFDPDGDYVRSFVPELKKVPSRWIHKPHLAPKEVLQEAGVILDQDYPLPLVNHEEARKEALKLYHECI